MKVATRVLWNMMLRSLGRPWFTRYSVGYIHYDQFHWTERAARARYEKLGGQILRRRGLYWDFAPTARADWGD